MQPVKGETSMTVLEGSASLQHVQSMKSMSSHRIPVPNTSAPELLRPPTALEVSAESQNLNQGGGPVVPGHKTYDDDLASGLKKIKEAAESLIIEPGIRNKILNALDEDTKGGRN